MNTLTYVMSVCKISQGGANFKILGIILLGGLGACPHPKKIFKNGAIRAF